MSVYRALLRTQGVPRILGAAFFGRLPFGAVGLVLLLRTEEMTGSYALGGVATGLYAGAQAVTSPVLSRLIDRRGQTRVLVATGLLNGLALCGFAALPAGAPGGAAIGLALLAGAAQPPLSPVTRTLWTALLVDPVRRNAAFALEAVQIEVHAVLAPLLIVGAIGSVSLAGAAVACAVLMLGGTLVLATSGTSRAWRGEPQERDLLGALRSPGVWIIALVWLLCGTSFAAVEIATAAFAEAHGAPGATGPLLAAWSLGSLGFALLAGHRPPPNDPARRLVLLLVLLALGTAPLLAAGSIAAFAVLVFVAGLAIAPTVVVLFGLVSDVAPAGRVTEAFTWTSTGLWAGFGIGGAGGGALVEAGGPDGALLLAFLTVAAAALLVAAASRGAGLRPVPAV